MAQRCTADFTINRAAGAALLRVLKTTLDRDTKLGFAGIDRGTRRAALHIGQSGLAAVTETETGPGAQCAVGAFIIDAQRGAQRHLLVEPVIGAGHAVHARPVAAHAGAQVERGRLVQQRAHRQLRFQLDAAGLRLAVIDLHRHPALAVLQQHVVGIVVDLAHRCAGAEHGAVAPVMLDRGVEPQRHLRLERRIAAAVRVEPAVVGRNEVPRHHVLRGRRLVRARQRQPQLVFLVGQLEQGLEQRAQHAGPFVDRCKAGAVDVGLVAFPAHAGIDRPAGGDIPFVLAVHGHARDARREILVQVGRVAARQRQLALAAGVVAVGHAHVPAQRQCMLGGRGLAVHGRAQRERARILALAGHALLGGLGHHRAVQRGSVAQFAAEAVAVGRVTAGVDAEFHVELGAFVQLAHPVQVGTSETVVAAEAAVDAVVVRARIGVEVDRGQAAGVVGERVVVDEGLPGQRVAAVERPVDARRQVDAVGPAPLGPGRGAVDVGHAHRIGARLRAGRHAVILVAPGVQAHGIRHGAIAVRQLQAGAGRIELAALGAAEFDHVLVELDRFFQHDIDGAGNRLRAELGAGRAQHLDAFDHVGRQVVDGKAGRRFFAVDQNLRIAGAQAAHADFAAAAPGRAAHRDAGDAFQHVVDGRVAVFLQFFAVDHGLAGGIVAARIVAGGRALDHDLLHHGFGLDAGRAGGIVFSAGSAGGKENGANGADGNGDLRQAHGHNDYQLW
uniref:Uncharacterized protein n=1 Tax=Tanacetum cinerariifolium TaxID=118510 RepID=A0A699GEZ0_TANCI|nr:hypothetical protein [Tanacetum cinerariifolium]